MKDQLRWGPWTLDRNSTDLVLRDASDHEVYFVALSDFTDSAKMLDWIAQISMKRWDNVGIDYSKAEVVGLFVGAVCNIIEPQSRLCPSGQHKEVTTPDAARWAMGAHSRSIARATA